MHSERQSRNIIARKRYAAVISSDFVGIGFVIGMRRKRKAQAVV
jgi:hypothetical protein